MIALTLFNWNLYDIGISGISDAAHAEHPELMGMVMIDSSDQVSPDPKPKPEPKPNPKPKPNPNPNPP